MRSLLTNETLTYITVVVIASYFMEVRNLNPKKGRALPRQLGAFLSISICHTIKCNFYLYSYSSVLLLLIQLQTWANKRTYPGRLPILLCLTIFDKSVIIKLAFIHSIYFRPAYMDEYEKLEEELKKVYEVC